MENTHTFKCNECERTEGSKENLEKHKRESHSAELILVDAYECEECDFEGNELDIMYEHVIEKHSKKQNGQFPCDNCDSTYKKRKQLLDHFRQEH